MKRQELTVIKVEDAPEHGNSERVVARGIKIMWGDFGKIHWIAQKGSHEVGDKVYLNPVEIER